MGCGGSKGVETKKEEQKPEGEQQPVEGQQPADDQVAEGGQ